MSKENKTLDKQKNSNETSTFIIAPNVRPLVLVLTSTYRKTTRQKAG